MPIPMRFRLARILTNRAARSNDVGLRRKALRKADATVARTPDAWAYLNRAQVLLGLADQTRDATLMKRCRDDFERAIALGCPLHAASLGRALALQWLGDAQPDRALLREAARELARLRVEDPNADLALLLAFEAFAWEHLAELGDSSARGAAARLFEHARGAAPDVPLADALAPVLRARRARPTRAES